MKKLFLSFLSLFLIASTGIAQTRIIERPNFENNNSGSLEIDKLVLKETETVLYCDFYDSPNDTILIAAKCYMKGKSGKIYKLLRSEGFELGKKTVVPTTGYISFKLHLKPLDKTENSFDLLLGEKGQESIITGIKTVKPKPVATPIHCLIKGTVIDRPYSNRIILTTINGSIQTTGIIIPIRDGKFEYELNCQNSELYRLTFYEEQRKGYPAIFFAESGVVTFKLFPMNLHYKNKVTGGLLNREYSQYHALCDSLFSWKDSNLEKERLKKEDRVFTEDAKQLMAKIQAEKNEHVLDSLKALANKLQQSGLALTPEAKALQDKEIKMGNDWRKWEIEYIRNNNTLVGYSLLLGAMNNKEEIQECINIFYDVYAKKYPKHHYTQQMKELILSYTSIKVGKPYVDFSAPSFSGKLTKLSEQIQGKVALIDLWASWCAPCRKKAKSMIPVYEAYKDKGFMIVGIARESTLADGVNAAKKDKYPWLNLIELKDKGKIWEKYNMTSAGASFLVDKNGIILAIDPTDKEVTAILEKLLK
jgi:thiol-disulfide isomerase/thioredoxin